MGYPEMKTKLLYFLYLVSTAGVLFASFYRLFFQFTERTINKGVQTQIAYILATILYLGILVAYIFQTRILKAMLCRYEFANFIKTNERWCNKNWMD